MKSLVYLSIVLLFCSCESRIRPGKLANGTLPFYNTADFSPRWPAKTSKKYDSIHTIPVPDLINQYGELVNGRTLDRKIYVTGFFCGSCQGGGKKLSTHLLLVQKAFENDSSVLVLSNSLSPQTDSPAALAKYAISIGANKNRWHLLTGDPGKLYQLARGTFFIDEAGGNVSMDSIHTENVLLIDTHKRIRGIYKPASVKEITDLIADIRTLRAEP